MFKLLNFCLILLPILANGQRIELDVAGGISNYQGDLQPLYFTLKGAKPAGGLSIKFPIIRNVYVKAGFSLGAISASDSKNTSALQSRNLSFQSAIKEFHLGVEYRFFNPERIVVTPYVFIGAGVFVYNPYTYTQSGQRVRLQPLGTEGQGLEQYPERKPYKLTQISIPYGFGIKWQVNCNLNIGIGFRQAKTFTDYLDDVSTGYVNKATLLNGHGQLAVDLAWRTDEYNGTPYPAQDQAGRGNPREADWYYFADFSIGLNINDCETGKFSLGGIFKNIGTGNGLFGRNRGGSAWNGYSKRLIRKKIGCPRF